MTTTFTPPPGFPEDDDGTEDGGGPPNTRAPFIMDALAYAIQLADKLAKIDQRPAYVINVDGHPHLASHLDFGDDGQAPYWTRDQIIYEASA